MLVACCILLMLLFSLTILSQYRHCRHLVYESVRFVWVRSTVRNIWQRGPRPSRQHSRNLDGCQYSCRHSILQIPTFFSPTIQRSLWHGIGGLCGYDFVQDFVARHQGGLHSRSTSGGCGARVGADGTSCRVGGSR
jgi:hypothetical protein